MDGWTDVQIGRYGLDKQILFKREIRVLQVFSLNVNNTMQKHSFLKIKKNKKYEDWVLDVSLCCPESDTRSFEETCSLPLQWLINILRLFDPWKENTRFILNFGNHLAEDLTSQEASISNCIAARISNHARNTYKIWQWDIQQLRQRCALFSDVPEMNFHT